MLHLLKRHPWSISARFDWSLALVFAVPHEVARQLMPPGLEPDLWEGWGFVAAAFVQTRKLRPSWAPNWLAQDFFLAGYRVFARARLPDGRHVRGLHILGSDTDSLRMAVLGRWLTHYGYRRRGIRAEQNEHILELQVLHQGRPTVDVAVDLTTATMPPQSSPFPDLRIARRFAGPMPFTFSHEPETGSLIVVEGSRQHWEPRAVNVTVKQLDFFAGPPFAKEGLPMLANAFWVQDVTYSWKPGMLVPVHYTQSTAA
jgi:hypothetical protein